jgi:hypothetical protein
VNPFLPFFMKIPLDCIKEGLWREEHILDILLDVVE